MLRKERRSAKHTRGRKNQLGGGKVHCCQGEAERKLEDPDDKTFPRAGGEREMANPASKSKLEGGKEGGHSRRGGGTGGFYCCGEGERLPAKKKKNSIRALNGRGTQRGKGGNAGEGRAYRARA